MRGQMRNEWLALVLASGEHLRLLDERRDEPMADAAVLDALADGEDAPRRAA